MTTWGILSTARMNRLVLAGAAQRPELGGGSLMDVGCYCLNALRILAGEPEASTRSRSWGRAAGVPVELEPSASFPVSASNWSDS